MEKTEALNKIKGIVNFGIQKLKKIPISELSRKGRCTVNIHNVDYVNSEEKPLCYKSGTCLDCHKMLEKREHVFGEYAPQGECKEVRYCIYCQEAKQERITHQYTKTYVDEKCNVWGVCEVCGHKRQMDEKQHQWKIVTEYDENLKKVKEVKKCLRCGSNGKILGVI